MVEEGGRGQLCAVPFFSSFPKIEKHCARGLHILSLGG